MPTPHHHHVTPDFVDRVFSLDGNPSYNNSLRDTYAAASSNHTFASVIEDCIVDGVITEPGHYCIIRLDRTGIPDAFPDVPYVGTVMDDMTLSAGLHDLKDNPQSTNITKWPPR